jgi:hypothetical protein
MADTTIPYQIVVFTRQHSVSGGVFLHEQRVSDYLNDSRDTNVMLRNTTVARLDNPAKIIEKTLISFIPKSGIVVAFEPPQKGPPPVQRFIKYPKAKYEVFLLAEGGMEVRGNIHMHGVLDLVHIFSPTSPMFIPITEANIVIGSKPDFMINQLTLLVNVRTIQFIGEAQGKNKAETGA